MAEKTMPTTSPKQAATARERTRAQERYLLPPVDIYETQDGLVLLADLPGVSQEDLQIRMEDTILTIEARPKHAMDAEPIYREFELVPFFRQFELSDEVDREKIVAKLRNGVLRLEMPRAEKAKPKQIPVQAEKTAA